ncbi:MAG TPA: hypothetical protein VFB79_18450 [Candidatus Angelobacter sp.]|nr:hypothetical protein [Candidatus Angelobacter sp.]
MILAPGGKDERSGTITIYRNQNQYRSEIELSGYRRIWLRLDNRVYVANSSPLAFLGLESDLENSWRETILVNTQEIKFRHESRKNTMGGDVWCIDEAGGDYTPMHLCFDTSSQTMLSKTYGEDRYEFSDFQVLEGKKYPGNIRRFRQGKLALEMRNLHAETGVLPEDAFQVPKESLQFETCENVVPPKLTSSPTLFPPRTFVGKSLKIFIYGIVAEDGSFTHVLVASVPRNPDLVKLVKDKVEQRRFTPAMCGPKPVATELNIEIAPTP